ncbi:hypothetical protein ACRYCC_25720 [Actinomadura scrupuli]|uniref:hypothetical protein n=1 Tax=Actinomadura scrupuli TaxID=559629 RepID=UPI003D95DC8F
MLEPSPPEPYDEQWTGRRAGEMSAMAAETPDINDLAARLERVEKFQHSTAYAQMLRIEQVQAQVAAPAAALGLLDFRIQQVQTELTGFRAETHTELETIKAVQAAQGEMLQEILDRLPPR